jgi:hypothetical protein
MSECHLALLQAAVVDRPYRPTIAAKPNDRRLWNEERAGKVRGRDVDLRLLAEIGIGWDVIECDLHPALFVDAIALRLDPSDPSGKSQVRVGPQDDIGRITDLDVAGLALINVGEDPDCLRVDQCKHSLPRAKR